MAPPAGRGPGGRTAGLSPAARADRPDPPRRRRAAGRRLRPRGEVRRPARPSAPPTRRHRLPDRAGGLRQVLHLLRGALYARRRVFAPPAEAIEAEARGLAAQGVREITLLGQNVNAYAGDGGLAALIRRLARIPGLDRIRYTTSHPRDMDDALIAAHGEVEALMPYLHLPVQSGSDRVLKAMNRATPPSSYLRLIERIRAARPDIAISGDFIVGFPGERDADFEATLALVREVGYASAFSFKYSRRPGTPGRRHARPGGRGGEGRAPGAVCRPCWKRSSAPSTPRWSGGPCRCCSKNLAGAQARSSAAAPICRPFTARGRRPRSGASSRWPSFRRATTAWLVNARRR